MQIVDSQVHTWDSVLNDSFKPHRSSPFGISDLLKDMNNAGVDGVVLVPPSWSAEGTPETIASLEHYPDRFRVIGRVSLEKGISPKQSEIESWAQSSKLVGLRLVLYTEELVERYKTGSFDWIWKVASDQSLPIMIYTPGNHELLRIIATEHPDLRFAADHLSLPIEGEHLSPSELRREIAKLLPLAELENLSVKASTLPIYSKEPFPFRDLHGPVYDVISAFGASRVFWGSDLSRLRCSYGEAVQMVSEQMTELSEEDRDLVLGGAILSWLNWDLQGSAT